VAYGLAMASILPRHRCLTLLELVARLEGRGVRHSRILRLVERLVREGRVRLTGCCGDGRFTSAG